MVEQTQSRTNHTSYRKFNFNEFVANVFRDNMGVIIFKPLRFWRLFEAKKMLPDLTSVTIFDTFMNITE